MQIKIVTESTKVPNHEEIELILTVGGWIRYGKKI